MPDSPPATLLLVDDDDAGRRLTTRLLRRAGFEVCEAATAAEALRLADGRTDLIILDVQLPDACGFDVCRAIKANPATASALVLHLSGVANTPADKASGLEGGADGYLTKPIDADELIAHVRALLRMRRAEEAARAGAERLRLLIDTAYDAFVAIDAGGVVIDWNRRAESVFGWSRDEVLGRRLADLVIPPRYRDKHQRGLTQAVRSGESPILNRLIEVTALHRDGHEFPAELMTSLVRHGDAYLFSAFARDVSDRKRAERHLAVRQAVSQCLIESDSLHEAMERILRSVCDITGWDAGAVWRVDRSDNVLRCLETWSAPGVEAKEFEALTRRLALAPGEGLPGRVWASRGPDSVLDFSQEPHFPRAQAAARAGLRGAFACPVPCGKEVTGVIEFFSRSVGAPDDLLAILGAPIGQMGQFLERQRAELERQRAEEARAESERLTAFTEGLGLVLRDSVTLEGMLQGCAEAMVRHLGAAFARIWMLNERTDVLELRASAGMYTHLDGPHSRVPVGQLKIGRIAQQRRPHLTNDVQRDPWVSDPEWARREGMVAFAGHPLMVGERLLGVVALFARQPLSDFTRKALAAAADHIAGGIQHRHTREALRATEAEFRIARRIQQQLFPRTPLAVAGFDVGGASHPAEATGGDYFDYIPLCDGAVAVAVGDVSGHGLGPALLMASLRATLRALARVHADVGEIVRLANRALNGDAGEQFVTLFLARLDPQSHSLVYASAGHETGYLLNRAGRVRLTLESTGAPLGVFPDAAFAVSGAVRLEPEEFVLLLTDGVKDALAPDGTRFGPDRALAIARLYRRDPATHIVTNLYHAVRAFTQETAQDDDISAVVIKRPPLSPPPSPVAPA
jgi:PAS domain S-box-containing protein